MKRSIAIITFLAVLALAGCGKVTPSADVAEKTTTTTSVATTEASPDELKLIGEKTDDSSAFVIELENKTGKDIKSFAVKTASDENYPANMLAKGETFEKNEKRTLYYIPTNSEGYAVGESDAVTSEEYTIKAEFSDGSSFVLHQFPFGDLKSASILFDGDTAYIEYTSTSSKEKVSTKEAEEMIETQKTSEEAPDNGSGSDEPVSPQTPDDEPVYTPPVTDAYIEPATEYTPPATTVYIEPDTQAPTQADPNGGCIGGQGLFN